jgi:hypothetical protein
MCLDWREICDGKIDCIGDNSGIDEKYSEEMEMTECNENEYRCYNGAQCKGETADSSPVESCEILAYLSKPSIEIRFLYFLFVSAICNLRRNIY